MVSLIYTFANSVVCQSKGTPLKDSNLDPYPSRVTPSIYPNGVFRHPITAAHKASTSLIIEMSSLSITVHSSKL